MDLKAAIGRLRKSPSGMAGAVIVTILILVAIFGPAIAPYGPNTPDYAHILQPPSLTHLGGTDEFGRDILSRVLYGERISLGVAALATVLGLVAGTIVGLIAGYARGALDQIVMRIVDVMLAFPGILLAIGMVAILGPGLPNIVIAIGLFSIPTYARLVRGSTIQAMEQDYVEAVRAQGAGPVRILVRHVLPNILTPIIVITTLNIAGAILAESGLSFLGLGAPPPTPEWGAMLSDAQNYLATSPYMAFVPGGALVIAVLGFNLLGDGLRDALDPRLRT